MYIYFYDLDLGTHTVQIQIQCVATITITIHHVHELFRYIYYILLYTTHTTKSITKHPYAIIISLTTNN